MKAPLAELFAAHLAELDARLTAALDTAGLDGLVVHAGSPPLPRWDDQPYPFRVLPLFAQWCPQPDAAGSAIVLAPGRKPRLVWLRSDDFWHAPAADPDPDWAGAFVVDVVATPAERDRLLDGLGPQYGVIDGDMMPDAAEGTATEPAAIACALLDFDRAAKTAYETACIAAANRQAAGGHLAAAAAFRAHASELEIDFAYMQASRQRSIELPYPNIVALDAHAAVLHYQHLDETPGEAGTLLIDAGARCHGYAADITRTQLAAKSPLADIHASLEQLQQMLCAEAVAGVEFAALNDRAHQLLAHVLADHALVTCDADVAYESGITRVFLPHGLGHLLGLQVHDVGGRQREPLAPPTVPPAEHPFLRLTRRLAAGFVVTIEPGLYFIDSLVAALSPGERRLIASGQFEALRSHGGIRIEDDVAVEAGDNTNLTRTAFAGA